MVAAFAELISYQINGAVKKIQSSSNCKISHENIFGLYVLLGCFLSSYQHLSLQKLKVKLDRKGNKFNSQKHHIFSRMELSGSYILCCYFVNNNWFW